jgi:hypothetical protein
MELPICKHRTENAKGEGVHACNHPWTPPLAVVDEARCLACQFPDDNYTPAARPQAVPGRDPIGQPCAHLGKETGEVETCVNCRGRWQIKLLACALHGQCTQVTQVGTAACCLTCPDYQV